jgi:hypothetical protein
MDYGLTGKEEDLIKAILRKIDEPIEGGGSKQRRFTRKVRCT